MYYYLVYYAVFVYYTLGVDDYVQYRCTGGFGAFITWKKHFNIFHQVFSTFPSKFVCW